MPASVVSSTAVPSNHNYLEGLVKQIARREVGVCVPNKFSGVAYVAGGEKGGTFGEQPLSSQVLSGKFLAFAFYLQVHSDVCKCLRGFMNYY